MKCRRHVSSLLLLDRIKEREQNLAFWTQLLPTTDKEAHRQ